MKILNIQSSSNKQSSVGRELSSHVLNELKKKYPNLEVTNRDLADGLHPLQSHFLGGSFKPAEEHNSDERKAIARSEELIQEIEGADLILAAVPMYNFSVPSNFKIWVDHIVRARRTFAYGESGPEGLIKGKKALLLTTMGGPWEGSDYDFLTPYLRKIFSFVGIEDLSLVNVQGTATAEKENAIRHGRNQLTQTIQAWA